MKLTRAKIRGLGATPQTSWFDLSPGLTLLQIPDETERQQFLTALQSVNPTCDRRRTAPFTDFPGTIKRHGHTRVVIPEKRTLALAIFGAPPGLVQDLAAISSHFYETDQIEIGRRLDYSRWCNFVELASSTRWQEISAEINQVCHAAPEAVDPEIAGLLERLAPEARIKGPVMDALAGWLCSMLSAVPETQRSLVQDLLTAVQRADFFSTARNQVFEKLPLFLLVDRFSLRRDPAAGGHGADENPSYWPDFAGILHRRNKEPYPATLLSNIEAEYDRLGFVPPGSLHHADAGISPARWDPWATPLFRLQVACGFSLAACRALGSTAPIMLFNSPENFIQRHEHHELANFLQQLSESVQCLYTGGTADLFASDSNTHRLHIADIRS